MNLKDSEDHRRPTGSKYLVGLSSAPYCNSKYPTHMVVVIPQCMSVIMMNPSGLMRGHLMAWSEKKAMQEYLQELTENSNLKRKEFGTVMSSEANEIGLEQLLKSPGWPPSRNTSRRQCMRLQRWRRTWNTHAQGPTCKYGWPGA